MSVLLLLDRGKSHANLCLKKKKKKMVDLVENYFALNIIQSFEYLCILL